MFWLDKCWYTVKVSVLLSFKWISNRFLLICIYILEFINQRVPIHVNCHVRVCINGNYRGNDSGNWCGIIIQMQPTLKWKRYCYPISIVVFRVVLINSIDKTCTIKTNTNQILLHEYCTYIPSLMNSYDTFSWFLLLLII